MQREYARALVRWGYCAPGQLRLVRVEYEDMPPRVSIIGPRGGGEGSLDVWREVYGAAVQTIEVIE